LQNHAIVTLSMLRTNNRLASGANRALGTSTQAPGGVKSVRDDKDRMISARFHSDQSTIISPLTAVANEIADRRVTTGGAVGDIQPPNSQAALAG
jgi:hypothetical protein